MLLTASIVAAGTVLYASHRPIEYQSSATIALLPDPSNPSTAVVYGQLAASLLPTYLQVIESRTFLDRVARSLPFSTSGESLQGRVWVQSVQAAGVMKLEARSPVPRRAEQIASAATKAFVASVASNGVVRVAVIDLPRVPEKPTAARSGVVIAAGSILAVLLAVLAALTWDRLFGRIRTPKELGDAAEIPVLGAIPNERTLRKNPRLVVGDASLRPLDEAYRALATNLVLTARESQVRSVGITSIGQGDGKTSIVANLGVRIAELGIAVLLVDADLHNPSLHQYFDVSEFGEGLSTLAASGSAVSSVVHSTPYPGLRFVSPGPPTESRAHELDIYLRRLPELLALGELSLIDMPPLRAGSDVRLLATALDSVVLVTSAGVSTATQIHQAVQVIALPGVHLLGTVINRTPTPSASITAYGYSA